MSLKICDLRNNLNPPTVGESFGAEQTEPQIGDIPNTELTNDFFSSEHTPIYARPPPRPTELEN